MNKLFVGAAGAVGSVSIVVAVTACSTTTTVVRAPAPKPTVTRTVTQAPKSSVTKTETAKRTSAATKTAKPTPATTTTQPVAPAAPATPVAPSTPAASSAPPGYLGDIFSGGTGNPCNFASGYQFGDCNPEGETEQQYIDNPGGPAPSTSTNAQGCYYVKMGEGYCPSTGTYTPMADPNG
jgi:hypothetical protein